jgi:hypothetical protein
MADPLSISLDPFGENDLLMWLSRVPEKHRDMMVQRIVELRNRGIKDSDIAKSLEKWVTVGRSRQALPGTETHKQKMLESRATQDPAVLDELSIDKPLGDLKKAFYAGQMSAPNLPVDIADISALGIKYGTPVGWLRGEKWDEQYHDFRQRLMDAVPTLHKFQEDRELMRESYIETANNPKAAEVALFAMEVGADPTNYSPMGLARGVAKGALVLGGLNLVRSALKKGAKTAAKRGLIHTDVERALMRRALQGDDYTELVGLAEDISQRGTRMRAAADWLDRVAPTPDAADALDIGQKAKVRSQQLLERAARAPESTQLGQPAVRTFERAARLEAKGAKITEEGTRAQRYAEEAAPKRELGEALDEASYHVLERAMAINEAQKKHGYLLDLAKFTDEELAVARRLKEAETAEEIFRYLPKDEFKTVEDYARYLADLEKTKAPPFGKPGAPGMARFFRWLDKHAGSRMGMPEEAFIGRIKAEQRPLVAAFDMNRLAKAVRNIIDNKYKDPQLYDAFGKHLTGEPGGVLPLDLQVLATEMRNSLDEVSLELLNNPNLDPALAKAIEENFGKYLHRDFEVVENPYWQREITDEAVSRARKHFEENYNLDDNQIDGILRSATVFKHNPILVVDRNLVSRAGRTVFRPRKDLSNEFLGLLGEHTDPFHKAVRSAYYMNLAAAEMEYNKKLGPLLAEMGHAIKADIPTAQFPHEMPMTPGFFTSREMGEVLESRVKMAADSWVLAMNGIVKAGKTVGSPATQAKNFLSNGWVAVALGHSPNIFDPVGRRGARLIRTESPKLFDDDELVGLVRELLEEGALGTNVDIGDLLEFQGSLENLLLRPLKALGKPGKKAAELASRGLHFGTRWYLTGDNFWKVAIYKKELDRYTEAFQKATPGLDTFQARELAKPKAIRVVRDATQNYNFLPRYARNLRRQIVVGPFASFPIESVRNFKNIIKVTLDDLSDPLTRSIGLKRLAGLSSVFLTEAAVGGFVAPWMTGLVKQGTQPWDIDSAAPSRKIAKNAYPFLPFYHQDREVIPMSWDGKTLKYMNISENNYFNLPMSVLRQVYSPQQDGTDFLSAIAQTIAQPILGRGLLLEPIVAFQDTLESDISTSKKLGRAAQRAFMPGFVQQGFELARSLDVPGAREVVGPTPLSRGDRGPGGEMLRFATGLGTYEINVPLKLAGAVSAMTSSLNAKKRDLSKRTHSQSDRMTRMKDFEETWKESAKRTIYLIERAREMGVSRKDIMDSLGTYKTREKNYLWRGKVPPTPYIKLEPIG